MRKCVFDWNCFSGERCGPCANVFLIRNVSQVSDVANGPLFYSDLFIIIHSQSSLINVSISGHIKVLFLMAQG